MITFYNILNSLIKMDFSLKTFKNYSDFFLLNNFYSSLMFHSSGFQGNSSLTQNGTAR